MIHEIRTTEDVKAFFEALLAEGLNFHPYDMFENYIHTDTKQPFYTEEETRLRNSLLAKAFNVCESVGADIYELCNDIFMHEFYKMYPPEN